MITRNQFNDMRAHFACSGFQLRAVIGRVSGKKKLIGFVVYYKGGRLHKEKLVTWPQVKRLATLDYIPQFMGVFHPLTFRK
jgi:hypothetical protein